MGVAAGRLGRCWGGRDLPAPCIVDLRAFDVTRAMEEVGCLDTCQIAWLGKSPEEHALHFSDLMRYSPGPDLQLGAGLGWGGLAPMWLLQLGSLGGGAGLFWTSWSFCVSCIECTACSKHLPRTRLNSNIQAAPCFVSCSRGSHLPTAPAGGGGVRGASFGRKQHWSRAGPGQ